MPQVKEREAPDGWHWGSGARSDSYYTMWLYTDKMLYQDGEFGWECQIFWDKGQSHTVQFIQYTKIRQDGDPEYGYPEHCRRFDSEREAVEYAIEKAAELR